MSGVVHPHALVLARAFPVDVETCQRAIVEAEGDLELAGGIVRVFVMANVWPDVQRMKENLRTVARIKREGEMAALALASMPSSGVVVE